MAWLTLARTGLILNFVGTVLLAFSFGKNLNDAHQTNRKGKPVYLASFLHPWFFYGGLAIIAVGFLLQLVTFYGFTGRWQIMQSV